MNKLNLLFCAFVLGAACVVSHPALSLTVQALDKVNAQKERIFKAKQQKTYDKYRRVVDARSVGRFTAEDIRKCTMEDGIIISRYGRDACSIHTTDANHACAIKEDCQSSCLAVTKNNVSGYGISPEPTNVRNKTGRCATHLHLMGCVTLANQETKCFHENTPSKTKGAHRR